MQNIRPPHVSTRTLERFLVVIGAAICLIVSAYIWLVFSKQQVMWPLPALYLLEMLAASALAAFDILDDRVKQFGRHGILIWTAVGVLLAFVIMGAWSIGFLFVPVAGLLAIAAILSDRRHGRNLTIHLGVALAAACAQVTLMLVMLRFL